MAQIEAQAKYWQFKNTIRTTYVLVLKLHSIKIQAMEAMVRRYFVSMFDFAPIYFYSFIRKLKSHVWYDNSYFGI